MTVVLAAGEFEFDGHDVHTEPSLEYFPATHCLQSSIFLLKSAEEVPAVQFVQTDWPLPEYFPARQ